MIGYRLDRSVGIIARRSTSLLICATVLGLTAILAVTRHDLLIASAMFFVASIFGTRAGKSWRIENASSDGLDSSRIRD